MKNKVVSISYLNNDLFNISLPTQIDYLLLETCPGNVLVVGRHFSLQKNEIKGHSGHLLFDYMALIWICSRKSMLDTQGSMSHSKLADS